MKYSGDVPMRIVNNIINCMKGYCKAIGVANKSNVDGLITLENLFDRL